MVTAIVVLSTAMMLMVILGAIVWIVSDLASPSLARALFVGAFTIIVATPSAWIGLRVAQVLLKRNRAYMEQLRRKRNS